MKKYAGFWRRWAAGFIDGLIFGVLGVAARGQFWPALLGLAYNVWMLGTYGATIGKMVMGIKVVKEDGKKVTYADAVVRTLSSYLSAIVLLIGYFNMLWDSKKQTWHDKIAKTIVVKV